MRKQRLSPASLAWVRQQGEAWWRDHQAGKRAAELAGRFVVEVPSKRPIPERPRPAVAAAPDRFRYATFGIGASEDLVRQAHAEGKLSASKRLGEPPPAGGAVPVPKARPKPPARPAARAFVPTPVPMPALVKAQIEAELGVKFTPAYGDRGKTTTVVVDVERLNAELRKDVGFHVGPGGVGPSAKPGAYQGFREFLDRARKQGIAIEQARIVLDAEGRPSIDNGRHRFAVLRDLGVKAIPVSVPRSQAAKFRRMFGR
jgi:hypothetical protein